VNAKIKILYCLQAIGSGGVERRRLSLAKLLPKEKYEIKVICTQVQNEFYKEFEAVGVEIIPVGLLKKTFDFTIHKKVQKVIDEFRPDIIHGAVFEGVTMALMNGFIKRVPIIVLEETSDPINRSWRANLLLKVYSLFADKFVGVSQASCNYLKDAAKIKPSKIKLINNGVKKPRVVADIEIRELKEQLGISNNTFVIGSVGRMVSDANKRFSDLIKAVSLLIKKGYEIKLILVGDGKERPGYESLAKELKVENEVIFTSYQNDVAKYYNIMNAFSLVSAHESFGLVLAEAMLHKLPVVATRVGGMQYIVDDKETGFLVEKFNVSEIADRLEQLYLNKDLQTSLGVKGYTKAINRYTEEQYVSEVEKMYVHLLRSKNIL